jgi:hypothetical protein
MARVKKRKGKSCIGCMFLYQKDEGYSNMTVTDTDLRCVWNANPKLPHAMPYDLTTDPELDLWDKTCDSRCFRYKPGEAPGFDVDGETVLKPDEFVEFQAVRKLLGDRSG